MRCPSCGNLNRPEARFCDACGTTLAESTPAAATADQGAAPVADLEATGADAVLPDLTDTGAVLRAVGLQSG